MCCPHPSPHSAAHLGVPEEDPAQEHLEGAVFWAPFDILEALHGVITTCRRKRSVEYEVSAVRNGSHFSCDTTQDTHTLRGDGIALVSLPVNFKPINQTIKSKMYVTDVSCFTEA